MSQADFSNNSQDNVEDLLREKPIYWPGKDTEPDDSIQLKVESLRWQKGDFGNAYPQLRSRRIPDGQLVITSAWHEVLESKLKEKRVKPGHRIGILYSGKHPEKKYEMYNVVNLDEPQDDTFSWDKPPDGEGEPGPDDWAQLREEADDELAV